MIINMLMSVKQNSFTHIRVLLVLTDRGILAQSGGSSGEERGGAVGCTGGVREDEALDRAEEGQAHAHREPTV
jgi:hypothetical protein